MRWVALAVPALLLEGLAPVPDVERIVYETHAGPNCIRPCTGATLIVDSDGHVSMETREWPRQSPDPQTRVRRWRVTPEQYAAFRARLAPYRPEGNLEMNDARHCLSYASHSPSIILSWSDGDGEAKLVVDLSCEFANRREMLEAIQGSPELLGSTRLP